MKNIALLLTITLIIVAVNSQAQTVQKKNYILNSHAKKDQNDIAAKKIQKNSHLPDSLTIEEKLMMTPLRNDLNYKINAPFKTARTKYFKATQIKHKLLLNTMDAVMKTWYTNKYDVDYFEYEWFHPGLQQRLSHQLPVNPGNSTLFPPINKWIQF